VHEHQTHDGQVARGAEAGPEARHFLDREGHDAESGFLHAQSAEFEPRSPQAQRAAVEEGLMEAVRHLTRGIGELVADGTIGGRRAVIDGRGRRRRLLAGLEAHVIEQSRFREVCLGDVAGVMDALPPAHEVQQAVCVGVEGLVGKAADILAVEEAVDPRDPLSGGLLDHVNRAVCARGSLLTDDTELHGWAASRSDWNWRASAPARKKELGSDPSGSRTRQAGIPCAPRRWASCSAACWPLWLSSLSKVT